MMVIGNIIISNLSATLSLKSKTLTVAVLVWGCPGCPAVVAGYMYSYIGVIL